MLVFDTGVPKCVMLTLFAITIGLVMYLYLTKKNHTSFIRNASIILLSGYVFLVLCSTLLFREESEEVRYMIHPFWSYQSLYYKRVAEYILNVLLFVPIGFLSAVAIKRMELFSLIVIGCGFSLVIEVLQLLFRRGVCSIDDIIHNALGFVLGYTAYRICFGFVHVFKHNHRNARKITT